MRAIDLYSGVGGWSLGLKLAGIDVIASYEYWAPANETNFKNNHHSAHTADIRRLAFEELPSGIDVIVGSPPCTQFSYSNRGGGGNLSDGLIDIQRFLEIVDYIKPKYWVMENVPRVQKIIQKEFEPDGIFSKFEHLQCEARVYDMSLFGLPQRRKRCIAGNINFDLLEKYAGVSRNITLGEILDSLNRNDLEDPIYGFALESKDLVDHVKEGLLTEEEIRINKANKTMHTVYNSMPFPDSPKQAVRTITATCTRVSRESVIVEEPSQSEKYRRLTARERASLQGFPLNYQFYGKNYSQKLKMIGNAMPPVFAYLIANSILGTSANRLKPLSQVGHSLAAPRPLPLDTPPEKNAQKYPATRSFCFAIPSLRMKSGVRFELSNKARPEQVIWQIQFFFGSSKKIRSIHLDKKLSLELFDELSHKMQREAVNATGPLLEFCENADIKNMQNVWAHKGPGLTRPFMLLDEVDRAGEILSSGLASQSTDYSPLIRKVVVERVVSEDDPYHGLLKLQKNAHITLAGLIIGGLVNHIISYGFSEHRIGGSM